MILASRSPRRKELLSRCGVEFFVYDSGVGELTPESGISLEKLPEANALLKARAVAEKFPRELVLGADTMVICDDRAFGKPEDIDAACRMLAELSGKCHRVVTGVALLSVERNISQVWSEVTRVRFRELSEEVIREYVTRVNTLDKAGAYAIQEYGDMLVDSIEGELENVVGLPLTRLKEFLVQFKDLESSANG